MHLKKVPTLPESDGMALKKGKNIRQNPLHPPKTNMDT